jgi:chaperonin GroES
MDDNFRVYPRGMPYQAMCPLLCGAINILFNANLGEIISTKQEETMIKPLNDRILVLRVQEEEKTAGGIIIPDTAKEKPQEGKVVAVGPGKVDDSGKRMPLDVKEGDRILFSKYAGTEIKIDGVEHLFMREDDILGILQ